MIDALVGVVGGEVINCKFGQARSQRGETRTSAAGHFDSSIPTPLGSRAGETASPISNDGKFINREHDYSEKSLCLCATATALAMLQWLPNGHEARSCDCSSRYVYAAFSRYTRA